MLKRLTPYIILFVAFFLVLPAKTSLPNGPVDGAISGLGPTEWEWLGGLRLVLDWFDSIQYPGAGFDFAYTVGLGDKTMAAILLAISSVILTSIVYATIRILRARRQTEYRPPGVFK